MSTQYVEIIIPSRYGGTGEEASPEKISGVVRGVAESLTAEYGGATAIPAVGYYENSDRDVVEENVTVVYSYVTGREIATSTRQCAFWVKEQLDQECVLLNINGTVEFI